MELRCNATFEGGGVRGIGHIGAVCVLEKSGYQFENVAGSSAGAIVASLLAAGYTCDEIKQEMEGLNYLKFKQKGILDRFGPVGKLLSIMFNFGIYSATYFEDWLHGLLLKKNKYLFGHVKNKDSSEKYMYALQVTASDLTSQKLLVFPRDLAEFGINPDNFSIATAVRMSMSIPIFYEPYRLTDMNGQEHLIVDGGLLSNYPVWILDDGSTPMSIPTFGFKFVDPMEEKCPSYAVNNRVDVLDYLKLIVATSLDGYDKQYISTAKGDFQRTIAISTDVNVAKGHKHISATDFGINKKESDALFENGVRAAEKFLKTWNFDEWKRIYRHGLNLM